MNLHPNRSLGTRVAVVSLGLSAACCAAWSAVLIDFEGLSDGATVGTTYAGQGVSFANAIALQAGVSLNEFDFPPHSGQVAVGDDSGSLGGSFTVPVASFEARFTYILPLTITAYQGASVVANVTSAFGENYVSSGNPPNELLMVAFPGGITSFTIEGDPAGSSFVMDDFTFASVPESSSAVAAAILLAGFGGFRCLRGRQLHLAAGDSERR